MNTPNELLSTFANTSDIPARRTALTELIRTKQLHGVVSHESFQLGLDRLARSVPGAASETDRLLAVATLLHAAATAPPIRADVESLLRDVLTSPLSDLHELSDVHDRLYAARAWRVVSNAWQADDLATAAVHEELGEAVRKECIEGTIQLTDDIEGTIVALRKALLALTFGTKKPGDSWGRRLNRVLAALTDTISRLDLPVGERAGRELGYLLDRGFRGAGRPESMAVRVDVVDQVAALTHALVRADFSHGGNGQTYEGLSVVSDWFTRHEWLEMCNSSETIARVRDDVQKALTLLAGAGKADNRLRDALATMAGSRANADSICRTLATQHPGIPDDVRDWLAGVARRTSSASAVESQERSIDEVLAELLIVMRGLTRAADMVQSNVLPEVSIVLPQQVQPLSRLTGLAEAMASKLSLAMKWRSLRLRGTVGQEVEFSPVEHRLDTGEVRSRRVRLLSPVVERISEDGVPRIVLKAPVEPIADRREPTAETST